MAMGRRKRERQEALFITAQDLPRSAGHPFYQALNRLLAEADFDRWVETRCARYYEQEEKRGQPSIPPGVYFRMLLVGYFEGIDSQRGIAWRCADSLALRDFLGTPLGEQTPDHSTLTNTRKRLPKEVFDEVFQFVLKLAMEKKLLAGKTVGVDSTAQGSDTTASDMTDPRSRTSCCSHERCPGSYATPVSAIGGTILPLRPVANLRFLGSADR